MYGPKTGRPGDELEEGQEEWIAQQDVFFELIEPSPNPKYTGSLRGITSAFISACMLLVAMIIY